MTEAKWQVSDDPNPMLDLLRETGRACDRKVRLFAVAFCRRDWNLLVDAASRKAVEAAELFADGRITDTERERAARTAGNAASQIGGRDVPDVAKFAATAAWYTAAYGAWAAARTTCDADAMDWYSANQIIPPHPPLLRDIFGNPFRQVTFEPDWRTSTVHSLASTIYAERAFDRLPVLADALQDAGCEHADILDHCRGPGPHVRGCWVVDLVLGKS